MSSRPLRHLDDREVFTAVRQAIVDAALEQLARRDDLDLNVADVVLASGAHNAAFYRVFGSKDRLLLAVAQEAVGRTLVLLRDRVSRERSPAAAIRAWARVLLRLTATPRAAASIQAFALERHRFLRRFPDSEEILVAPVKRVLLDVLVPLGVGDANEIVDAAYELVMGQQATWIARRHEPTSTELSRCLRMVVRLVASERSG